MSRSWSLSVRVTTVLALALGLLAFFFFAPTYPGITPAQFDLIKEGMTTADVERICGTKCDQNLDDFAFDAYELPTGLDLICVSHVFADRGACIIISVDGDDVVYAKMFAARRSVWSDLRAWFRMHS